VSVAPGALRETAWVFLKIGCTAFGGPAAHVAVMEDELVRRRRWVTREEFLDLLGAANLIPGPNSTELAIHLGHRRAGFRGLVVAGACFILPAALLTLALAWAYVQFGARPRVVALLHGLKPVVFAVVAVALARFARTALKSPALVVVGVAAAVASAWGAHELLVLAAAGALTAAWRARARGAAAIFALPCSGLAAGAASGAAATAAAFSLGALFLYFLEVGAVLFGSGYVLIAFLRSDLVERWGWLTETQLVDAIAAGQVTPGPVFSTATFVGYVLGGLPGAAVATLGIFLPAFAFVAASGPLVPRIRRSRVAGAFLDGVNVASLALVFVVGVRIARPLAHDPTSIVIAAIAAVLLFHFRVSSAWLVLGGALAGLAVRFFD